MIDEINPSVVRCMPGKAVVQITEVLGGEKNGIFIPAQDGYRKDTAMVRVVKVGEPPRVKHDARFNRGAPIVEDADLPWPDSYRPVSEGDVLVIPRDVPKVFVWDDKRFAIIEITDVLFKVPESVEAEVIPWPSR